jgi:hypothetical protein
MTYVEWSMKGPEFVTCNCDYGCPCQFNGRPTSGDCQALSGMIIEEGHFGQVLLDGLSWVGVWSWPGAIHQGDGTMQMIIDETADSRQREALSQILHGEETEPGTTMLQVFSTTMSKVHEPLYLPIEFEVDVDERTARLSVPGQVEARGEPIRNPVTGAPHQARIQLPKGFEFDTAEVASGSFATHGVIRHDHAGVHAHLARIHLTQNGVSR